ncbi:4-deoxy-4-formamido-L-arabinose-phosphoundecaprenol deformylase [Thorsellia anophelis]|uniref:Probable 4-deoxy-4-formamido-L-arabinose-phosphoundecaprenol deformylase ArnD n=1 Tax=Thorsellia anophelis DSM 18579 TaxID=1123402 RepID=A0A1I0BN59_9GAMM|nr:4-deoxy-4-formamido-L-arabinose-phosphoundecaprenol deformylase [Thorsellia anophelis]SET08407.1 undecaprenyl phosphate-alpha-L-ara4FN deformylase [Thorsellia anophelis DSM 18579]
MKVVGLRIDVDTLKGTSIGVPNLLEILAKHNIKASFYFSVGPDNMGRHFWRLLRPHFLKKMLMSKAYSLYGWSILTAGTAWPGKLIGKHARLAIQMTKDEQHEIGMHAWDHHAWQRNIAHWPDEIILRQIELAMDELIGIVGNCVTSSAVAGWRATQRVIDIKSNFNFTYNSDCRGDTPFFPLLSDGTLGTIQVPVSLPTYDEIIGHTVSEEHYNAYILDKIHLHSGVPVYTIHAEVEGISKLALFENFLTMATKEQISFCPLIDLIPSSVEHLPICSIAKGFITGREGWVAQQKHMV